MSCLTYHSRSMLGGIPPLFKKGKDAWPTCLFCPWPDVPNSLRLAYHPFQCPAVVTTIKCTTACLPFCSSLWHNLWWLKLAMRRVIWKCVVLKTNLPKMYMCSHSSYVCTWVTESDNRCVLLTLTCSQWCNMCQGILVTWRYGTPQPQSRTPVTHAAHLLLVFHLVDSTWWTPLPSQHHCALSWTATPSKLSVVGAMKRSCDMKVLHKSPCTCWSSCLPAH